MVNTLEAQIQWTFALVLSGLTIQAVSYGGGIIPKEYVWFFGLRRWLFPPVMGISIVLATVFTLSGVGVFLWFRMRDDFEVDYYDAVLGLHAAVLGLIFLFGKMFFVWHYFLTSVGLACVAFAAALVALVLMGVQGSRANKWAPFGFYFILPVFLFYLFCQCFYIWVKNRPSLRSCMKKLEDVQVESSSISATDAGHYYSKHSSTRHATAVSSNPQPHQTDFDF